MPFVQEVLGILQVYDRFLKRIGGIAFRAGEPRDLDGIFGFGQLQRAFWIHLDLLILTAVPHVLAALQQFEFRIHLLNGARRVIAYEVFSHHDVAGLSYGEVRLGSDDQAKRLKIGGREQLGMVALEHHFPKIGRPAFGRDAPQYIGHVLRPELAGWG